MVLSNNEFVWGLVKQSIHPSPQETLDFLVSFRRAELISSFEIQTTFKHRVYASSFKQIKSDATDGTVIVIYRAVFDYFFDYNIMPSQNEHST